MNSILCLAAFLSTHVSVLRALGCLYAGTPGFSSVYPSVCSSNPHPHHWMNEATTHLWMGDLSPLVRCQGGGKRSSRFTSVEVDSVKFARLILLWRNKNPLSHKLRVWKSISIPQTFFNRSWSCHRVMWPTHPQLWQFVQGAVKTKTHLLKYETKTLGVTATHTKVNVLIWLSYVDVFSFFNPLYYIYRILFCELHTRSDSRIAHAQQLLHCKSYRRLCEFEIRVQKPGAFLSAASPAGGHVPQTVR